MAKWINHVAIAAPRNGGTTHAVDPSSGTTSAGSLFSPTSGNLLMCLVTGAVTSTTPTGWTLPTNGSAIDNGGLYVWWRTAAGGDTFTTTHNGADYQVVFDIYEFPSGTTFGTSATAIAVSTSGGAGPTLSGLSGTNLICAAVEQIHGGASTSTTAWSAGTEAIDVTVAASVTDGYTLSMAYMEDSVLTSWSSAATMSGYSGNTERLVFALKVATAAPAYPFGNMSPTPRYR